MLFDGAIVTLCMAQAYELVIPIRDIMSLYDACDRNQYDNLLLTTHSVDHFDIRGLNRPEGIVIT